MPDARLIITIDFCDNFPQINLMVPLKISHQMVEPKNTPLTSETAKSYSTVFTKPKPAKTAVKNKMVMGLDIVRKKEEKNDCLKAFMINKVN